MSYGFAVYNDLGLYLINENYSNYLMQSQGSGVYSVSSQSPAVSAGELLFVRPSTLSSTTVIDTVVGTRPFARTTGGTSVSMDWVKMKKSPPPSSENYGIRVYQADGSLAYDSGFKPLSPIASATLVAVASYSARQSTVTLPPVPVGKKGYISAGCLRNTGVMSSGAMGFLGTPVGMQVIFNSETSVQLRENSISGMD